MRARLGRLALLTLLPTSIDVAVLVALRQGAGWVLVAADLIAIAVASLASYTLHRAVTFRSDPYVRWVRIPLAFVAVASVAALVDVAVLRALYAAQGFDTTGGLVAAKTVALGAAGCVRLLLYRATLLGTVRRALRQPVPRPAPPGELRASVVVPAYREAERIAATVGALRSALMRFGADGVEVIVVDDGSGDGTADAALAAGADQVVVLPWNRGKGAAVRAGVLAARGRAIAFTDADLSYSPDQALALLQLIDDGWDVAVGNRRHPQARTVVRTSLLRELGSRAINLLALVVLLSRPHDTQCGLKAFRSDAAQLVFGLSRIDGFAFDIELLHLVERHGLTLAELPVRVSNDERTTVRAGRDTARLLRDLWRIRHLSATGAYELPAGVDPFPAGPGPIEASR